MLLLSQQDKTCGGMNSQVTIPSCQGKNSHLIHSLVLTVCTHQRNGVPNQLLAKPHSLIFNFH